MMNSVPATGSGRRRPEASGRAQRHALELHAGDLVARVRDDARGRGLEDGPGALLEHLVDLVGGGHVLHVAAIDERDLRAALAHGRARAVHRGEAAADDHDALALVVRVGQAERGDAQVLQAVDDAVGVLAGDAQLVGVVAADGHDDRVEALVLEVVDGEVHAQLGVADELDAQVPGGLVLGLEHLHLGQAVLGDAVAEHAARLGVTLEDGHVVAVRWPGSRPRTCPPDRSR